MADNQAPGSDANPNAQAIAALDAADLSAYQSAQDGPLDDSPTPEPEAQQTDDAGDDAGTDLEDPGETPTDDTAAPSGDDTAPTTHDPRPSAGSASAGAGKGTPAAPADPFAAAKARIATAREQLGDELVDALGLDELINVVQVETAPIRQARQRAEQAAQQQADQATRMVAGWMDKVAAGDAELQKLLGKGTLNPEQAEFRNELLETAQEKQRQSIKAAKYGGRKTPLSDAQALQEALVELTGRTDDPAHVGVAGHIRARARQVRRGGQAAAPASASLRGRDQNEAQAHDLIDSYLQGRREAEAG